MSNVYCNEHTTVPFRSASVHETGVLMDYRSVLNGTEENGTETTWSSSQCEHTMWHFVLLHPSRQIIQPLECLRSALRESKISKFSGGACPQTLLQVTAPIQSQTWPLSPPSHFTVLSPPFALYHSLTHCRLVYTQTDSYTHIHPSTICRKCA